MEMKCVKNYDYVRRTSTCRYEENATYDDLYGKQLLYDFHAVCFIWFDYSHIYEA